MTQTQPVLAPFEGHDVVGSRIKITRAGDGLSEALKVAPVELSSGDDVYVVLQGKVGPLTFVPDENGNYVRVHTVVTDKMALINADTATKAIQSSAEETERLRAEQAGQLLLAEEHAAIEREKQD